jgi:hypothetical protein
MVVSHWDSSIVTCPHELYDHDPEKDAADENTEPFEG